MPMDRATKESSIKSMQDNFSAAKSMIVVHYKGLTVAEITELRNKAREGGVLIQVTKNSLTKRAITGTAFEGLKDLFKGPTAVAYSDKDEVAPAKAIVNFSKKNEKLEIVGGVVGENILDVAGVKSIATLPSLDESRAKLVGLLVAPASKLARLLQTPATQVARAISLKPETTTVAEATAEAKPEAKPEGN